jgi:hypothetical protein
MADLRSLSEDFEFYHHWHGPSQRYAGGDCLATALMNGWQLDDTVLQDTYWGSGGRQVNIYHFVLHREDKALAMPVLGNPYVDRLVKLMELRVVTVERATQWRMRSPVANPVEVAAVS